MNSVTRQLLLLLPFLMLVAACGGGADDSETAATGDTMAAGPLSVADTPTLARAADGTYEGSLAIVRPYFRPAAF